MIPILGGFSISFALGLSIISIFCLAYNVKTNNHNFYIMGWRASFSVSILSVFATLLLVVSLLKSNFDIDYVAHYTSLETPTIYKITALWAGQSGSLLFWLFILSVYSIIVLKQSEKNFTKLTPVVIAVLVSIQTFFLIIVNFITNPFAPTEASFIVSNGNGLNPLLQNITMAIHPPTLYLGYVGFSVPFAFAIAALIKNDSSPLWVMSIRRWTLVTWLFHSAGVILGGWWAYQELGWGGYWAWDPVENASFMPWLTATAFLHSIILQEKRGLLKIWNLVLIILTFTLCIFGTFLTRSGVMSSVHSFTASDLGPLFLGYVFFILLISFSLVLYRAKDMKATKRIESITSRESGFLFNNVIFLILCFTVFWGTIFPVLSEAVTGTKITVGAPFFNQVNTPIGLLLLFLIGVGPLLVWKKTSKNSFMRNFLWPIIFGILFFIIGLFLKYSGYVLISFSLIGFVLTAILYEFIIGIRVGMRMKNENLVSSLIKIISNNRSRYGGYIVHLGILFIFVGFTGKAFDREIEFSIKAGDKQSFSSYNFTLNSLKQKERPNHLAWIADIDVYDNNNLFITKLSPEKRVYFHNHPNPDKRQPHSELSIYSTFQKDIYSIFSGLDKDDQTAYLKIMINPLVRWVWMGGFVLVFGTMISLWPRKNILS